MPAPAGSLLLDAQGRVLLDAQGRRMLSDGSPDPCRCCAPALGSCSITAAPYNGPDTAVCADGCGDTPFGYTVNLVDVTACAAGCNNINPPPFFTDASVKVIGDFTEPVSVSRCYTRGHEYEACGSFAGGWVWAAPPFTPTCQWNGQWPPDNCGGLWPATLEFYSDYGCNAGDLLSTQTVYGFRRTLATSWDSVTGLMTVELSIGAGGGSASDGLGTVWPANMFYGSVQFTPADVESRCYFSDLVIINEIGGCDPTNGAYAGGGQAEVDVCCAEGVPLGAAPKSVNTGALIAEPRRSADGDKWGPPLWREIHQRPSSHLWTMGKPDRGFLRAVAQRVPCGFCRVHWLSVMQRVRWDWSSRRGYFASTVEAHNLVNRAIGKPDVAVAEAAVLHGFTP